MTGRIPHPGSPNPPRIDRTRGQCKACGHDRTGLDARGVCPDCAGDNLVDLFAPRPGGRALPPEFAPRGRAA